jgi:hypothetical protein
MINKTLSRAEIASMAIATFEPFVKKKKFKYQRFRFVRMCSLFMECRKLGTYLTSCPSLRLKVHIVVLAPRC